MKAALAVAAVLLAAPFAARADIGLRVGGNATIANHNNPANGQSSTNVITDHWPVGLDAMLSYWLPGQIVSIDLELGEQWLANSPSANSRVGTVFRPGVRVSPPVFPVYARVAVPINFDQPAPYSRETFDLRMGLGVTIPVVLFKIYIEGDADFPLGGGNVNVPSAFSEWAFVLNAGVDFRF
jgi:hypothetical protein